MAEVMSNWKRVIYHTNGTKTYCNEYGDEITVDKHGNEAEKPTYSKPLFHSYYEPQLGIKIESPEDFKKMEAAGFVYTAPGEQKRICDRANAAKKEESRKTAEKVVNFLHQRGCFSDIN